ncbi:retrovirus-related pol polyprotein from transposon TNT 1-94, partial [Tanacetum coccineum]
VIQIVLWYLDSGCSKHMTGDRSQLTNFVNKFLGTVKFRNDHVAKILGYDDYQIGNVTILRVYYVEGLGHNLFFVGQFCDSNLEVAFRQHTCFIHMMASSLICLLLKASKTKSWLWHRHLSHMNFRAINHLARHGLVRGLPKLKFEKYHLCSACAMGKSKKKPHKPKSEDINQEKLSFAHGSLWSNLIYAKALFYSYWSEALLPLLYPKMFHHTSSSRKTPMSLLHVKTYTTYIPFHVLVALCYPTNDSENLGKLQPKGDIAMALNTVKFRTRTFMEMTPATISSGLVSNPHPSTPFVPPSRTDWDILFQPLFDELLNPPSSVDRLAEVVAPKPATLTTMQIELNEFERLKVWELVPRLDKVTVITLKWIYKVKLDELGGILKNKARLVARGYRQEEGIDFEESFMWKT